MYEHAGMLNLGDTVEGSSNTTAMTVGRFNFLVVANSPLMS